MSAIIIYFLVDSRVEETSKISYSQINIQLSVSISQYIGQVSFLCRLSVIDSTWACMHYRPE